MSLSFGANTANNCSPGLIDASGTFRITLTSRLPWKWLNVTMSPTGRHLERARLRSCPTPLRVCPLAARRFLIPRLSVSGYECAGSEMQTITGPPISPSATSVTLKFPKTMSGSQITEAGFRVDEDSIDGPHLQSNYTTSSSCYLH